MTSGCSINAIVLPRGVIQICFLNTLITLRALANFDFQNNRKHMRVTFCHSNKSIYKIESEENLLYFKIINRVLNTPNIGVLLNTRNKDIEKKYRLNSNTIYYVITSQNQTHCGAKSGSLGS